jgi:UDP-perosamine 4-acetyltransferase
MKLKDNPICLVFGGGGHGRVVMDALRAAGLADGAGILDADHDLKGSDVSGAPVLGDDGYLGQARKDGYSHFIVGTAGLNDPGLRWRLFAKGLAAGLKPLSVCHPRAALSPDAELGAGAVVLAGAVVNPGAVVGDNAIINSAAVVEHDCIVGDCAHIAPGAVLLGGVTVGRMAFVGGGAVVAPGLKIGDGAVIGAGAVVTKDVKPGVTVAGVPARPVK